MITTPAPGQLISAIKTELAERIVPAVAPSDKALGVQVEMMMGVLDMLAIRAPSEIAWMLAEIDSVVAHASSLRDADGAESISAGLDALATAPGGYGYDDVRSRYEIASELLSQISEHAYASGDADLQAEAWRLQQERVNNELAAIGVFVAVGRVDTSGA